MESVPGPPSPSLACVGVAAFALAELGLGDPGSVAVEI